MKRRQPARRAAARLVVDDGEHSVRHGQRHHGGEHGEPGGGDERRPEAVLAEDGLTDHGADTEPGEHGDGEVARRLGPPVGWRQVGDERGRADEQGGLADAGDAAEREERRHAVDGGARHAGETGEQGAGDHHPPPAVALDETADHRPGADGGDGERRDAQSDAELAGAELVLDEARQQRHEHADVDEEGARRRGDRDERLGEQARRGHVRHVAGCNHPNRRPDSPLRHDSHPDPAECSCRRVLGERTPATQRPTASKLGWEPTRGAVPSGGRGLVRR